MDDLHEAAKDLLGHGPIGGMRIHVEEDELVVFGVDERTRTRRREPDDDSVRPVEGLDRAAARPAEALAADVLDDESFGVVELLRLGAETDLLQMRGDSPQLLEAGLRRLIRTLSAFVPLLRVVSAGVEPFTFGTEDRRGGGQAIGQDGRAHVGRLSPFLVAPRRLVLAEHDAGPQAGTFLVGHEQHRVEDRRLLGGAPMGEDVVVRTEDSHAGGGDCLIGGGENSLEGGDRDRGVLPGPGAFRVSAAGGDDDPAVGGLLSGDRRGGGHDLDGELPGQAASRQMVVPGGDVVLVEGRVRAVAIARLVDRRDPVVGVVPCHENSVERQIAIRKSRRSEL